MPTGRSRQSSLFSSPGSLAIFAAIRRASFTEQLRGGAPSRLVVIVDVTQCLKLASRTMKQLGVTSVVHGGGKRRDGGIYEHTCRTWQQRIRPLAAPL